MVQRAGLFSDPAHIRTDVLLLYIELGRPFAQRRWRRSRDGGPCMVRDPLRGDPPACRDRAQETI